MSEQNKIDEIKAKVTLEDRIVWYSEKEEMFYVGGPVNEQGKRPVIAECLSESVAESFAKSPEYITHLLAEIERKDEALKRIEEELTDDTSEKAQRINEIMAREAL